MLTSKQRAILRGKANILRYPHPSPMVIPQL